MDIFIIGQPIDTHSSRIDIKYIGRYFSLEKQMGAAVYSAFRLYCLVRLCLSDNKPLPLEKMLMYGNG